MNVIHVFIHSIEAINNKFIQIVKSAYVVDLNLLSTTNADKKMMFINKQLRKRTNIYVKSYKHFFMNIVHKQPKKMLSIQKLKQIHFSANSNIYHSDHVLKCYIDHCHYNILRVVSDTTCRPKYIAIKIGAQILMTNPKNMNRLIKLNRI